MKTIFKISDNGPDQKEALIWAESYQNNILDALKDCSRGDWLIWMMTRLKVKPQSLIYITYQCVLPVIEESLYTFGDLPFRRGLHIVSEWLDGEATVEDCQNSLDELDAIDGDLELEKNDYTSPMFLADEIVSYLLNACIDISEKSSRSDLACHLAWAIYTSAQFQELCHDLWGNRYSLRQSLTLSANFIRQFSEYQNLLSIN